MRTPTALLLLLLLSACAARAPRPIEYACSDGKRFSLTYPAKDMATVEFGRMRFPLRREVAASGERFSCDVLTLTLNGKEASLAMDGQPGYVGCRVRE